MSIVFHHYKILNYNILPLLLPIGTNGANNHNSIILQKELDKWKTYSTILKKFRDLFNQMLQSLYKYSNAINAKGRTIFNRIINNVLVIITI